MPPDLPRDGSGSHGATPTPDEHWLEAWLTTAWRRWRVWIGLRSIAGALGVGLLTYATLTGRTPLAFALAAVIGIVAFTILLFAERGLRDWRPVVLAAEAAAPATRNALVAWQEMRGEVSPIIAARLATQARRSLEVAGWPRPRSLAPWGVSLVLIAAGILANIVGTRSPTLADADRERLIARTPAAPLALGWTAIATPPAYAHRPMERVHQPSRLDVLAGTRVEIQFRNWPDGARARLGHIDAATTMGGTLRSVHVMPAASDVLQVYGQEQQVLASITLVVVPDAAPTVRITAPASDLRRDAATGIVPIRISAQDDLALRDLRLRFTKVSGSGESFTFEDGEWPVQVRRPSERQWTGSHEIDLAALGLGPGDSLVYHAVAHDARIGADGAAESERFLIEITRPGALAAGDFSLPEKEEKFALSQRMVIQLTERLLEKRPRMSAEAFGEQAQALAIAQRRVRAEFVFMLGGEVEDEFEEAAQAHEVEEGRQANQGRGDLTEAVRQMSQAETRLTAHDVREALPYEYRALTALQAAFGKARYFMRTLPAAVQIDTSRRLQGDRTRAASAQWRVTPLPDAMRTAGLALLGRLESAGAPIDALLPELVALDRGNPAWVALIQEAATTEGAKGVGRALRARLLPGSPAWMPMPLARTTAEAAVTTPVARAPR
ncbi:hypothetical protein LuPra_03493 [Luteitalea pratensis]|uniref:DUF4175 domain-containing protein n=1 Tax=Luteitalea pratensis TaxID=1855912 RepID=A0A143PQ43_LUTPR|nr:DUF4175 family protein [Luteitalea pratensis]AMY10263.1 hypothetical protein LuPra_03493 [Luteitalea pratensis]